MVDRLLVISGFCEIRMGAQDLDMRNLPRITSYQYLYSYKLQNTYQKKYKVNAGGYMSKSKFYSTLKLYSYKR